MELYVGDYWLRERIGNKRESEGGNLIFLMQKSAAFFTKILCFMRFLDASQHSYAHSLTFPLSMSHYRHPIYVCHASVGPSDLGAFVNLFLCT